MIFSTFIVNILFFILLLGLFMIKKNSAELWRLYEETAWEYNNSPLATVHGFMYQCTQEKFDELLAVACHLPDSGALLLDLGTGMGIGPRFAKKLGARVITVDAPFAEHSLENAKLAGIECHLLDFIETPLPFETGSIDCVLFGDVIEHLLHSPKFILSEIFRVLKKGGACVASTPNAVRLSVRLKVLFGFSNWPLVDDFFESSYHGGHHHEYTDVEFEKVFRLVGFEIETMQLTGSVAGIAVENFAALGSRTRKNSLIGQGKRDHPLIFLAKACIRPLEKLHPRFRPQMLLVATKV